MVSMAYLGPVDWDALHQRALVEGATDPLLRRRRGRELWWLVHYCGVPLGVVVVVPVAAAAAVLLHLPTAGRPMVAIFRLGRKSPEKLEVVAVVEAARSAVPSADGQTRDPIGKVVEGGHLLGGAEVAPGDTVPGVAQAVAGPEVCCGRGYPNARREAAVHRPHVQREAPRLEVQQLPHEERLLALPFQPRAMEWCPVQAGGRWDSFVAAQATSEDNENEIHVHTEVFLASCSDHPS